MRKTLYPAAALVAVLAAIFTSRAASHSRASLYYFKLLPSLSPTSLHTLTTTTNWTQTTNPPSCFGTSAACVIGSNTTPTATGYPFYRHIPTIPIFHRIPAQEGDTPGYYVNYVDISANITDAFSTDL